MEGRLVARPGVVAILTRFENLTDPRVERTKQHLLLDMVAISLCAAICGANSWVDVEKFGIAKRTWFERFLGSSDGSVRGLIDKGHADSDWSYVNSSDSERPACPPACCITPAASAATH